MFFDQFDIWYNFIIENFQLQNLYSYQYLLESRIHMDGYIWQLQVIMTNFALPFAVIKVLS